MTYEYSRNTNKSKVTVSCETVKSRSVVEMFFADGQAPVRP